VRYPISRLQREIEESIVKRTTHKIFTRVFLNERAELFSLHFFYRDIFFSMLAKKNFFFHLPPPFQSVLILSKNRGEFIKECG
jgi:hypothetical protein